MNRCVEKFVNSTGKFPDFMDILDLVKKTNSEENIKLSEDEVEETGNLFCNLHSHFFKSFFLFSVSHLF